MYFFISVTSRRAGPSSAAPSIFATLEYPATKVSAGVGSSKGGYGHGSGLSGSASAAASWRAASSCFRRSGGSSRSASGVPEGAGSADPDGSEGSEGSDGRSVSPPPTATVASVPSAPSSSRHSASVASGAAAEPSARSGLSVSFRSEAVSVAVPGAPNVAVGTSPEARSVTSSWPVISWAGASRPFQAAVAESPPERCSTERSARADTEAAPSPASSSRTGRGTSRSSAISPGANGTPAVASAGTRPESTAVSA